MRRLIPFAITFAFLFVLLNMMAVTPRDVAAFDKTWTNYSLINVGAGEYGLWDDIAAGKGKGDREAALFWFQEGDAADEAVGYKTTDVNVSTDLYRVLEARAALSDGAEFSVGFALDDPNNQCNFVSALKWTWVQAKGVYLVKSKNLPAHHTVRAICIYMTDWEDTVMPGRANALIDYIRLADSTGKVGWDERFAGSP